MKGLARANEILTRRMVTSIVSIKVQETSQFLPATAMHEAGKFELLNVAEVDGR